MRYGSEYVFDCIFFFFLHFVDIYMEYDQNLTNAELFSIEMGKDLGKQKLFVN